MRKLVGPRIVDWLLKPLLLLLQAFGGSLPVSAAGEAKIWLVFVCQLFFITAPYRTCFPLIESALQVDFVCLT